VAIAWQGNPDYRHDARRSIPLAAFAPLADDPALRFVALQRGHGLEQLARIMWRDRVIDPGPALDSDGAFRDSAAILTAADLLVTSDTALAHLAGALGVRVWLALCDMPDWRWGLQGATTPWYPTM